MTPLPVAERHAIPPFHPLLPPRPFSGSCSLPRRGLPAAGRLPGAQCRGQQGRLAAPRARGRRQQGEAEAQGQGRGRGSDGPFLPSPGSPGASLDGDWEAKCGRRWVLWLMPLASSWVSLAPPATAGEGEAEGTTPAPVAAPEPTPSTGGSESKSDSNGGSGSESENESGSGSGSGSESESEGESESGTAQPTGGSSSRSGEVEVTSQVYLELAVEGKPVGRIVIGLFGKDVPLGAARLQALARGDRGISLRRKEFLKLTPSFVQNAGLRTFSLSGSAADEARIPGGTNAEALLPELQQAQSDPRPALHNTVGAVSLLAFDPDLPPPKQRLIAKDGRLVTVEEEVRAPPNGTEFTIVFEDSPQLDASHLVVGRVLEGQDTAIAAIRGVPFVADNSGSPYFRAAKLIGDSRAVVAERGFYRPYKKIVVTKCGVV